MSPQTVAGAASENPLLIWTSVTAVLAFILRFGRPIWDAVYGLKPRADVLVELFDVPNNQTVVIDGGSKDLRLIIVNSGFRAFSVHRVSIVERDGRSWRRVSPEFDSASTHAETAHLEKVFLAPGQMWTHSYEGKIDWILASHLEVEIFPRRWLGRPLRRVLPHASRNARKWHRFVVRQLKAALRDFDIKEAQGSILVGRDGTGVSIPTNMVVVSPDAAVGDTTVTGVGDRETIVAEVIGQLSQRLPKLFDANVMHGGLGPRVRWNEKVRANAANGDYLGRGL